MSEAQNQLRDDVANRSHWPTVPVAEAASCHSLTVVAIRKWRSIRPSQLQEAIA